MAKTETIRARVDAKLKADAEKVLDELGLNASDAIRLFYFPGGQPEPRPPGPAHLARSG